ncbi:hypothetical protein LEP1GSC059_3052 [Leptospira noguchii serovar Panama str. CZ214]|uniref:Uncharacterized protein n=1 Tax=Leptospira noguchii serovar Panama str. CZ214 TaxID=1001595 RepID=T0GUI9_9LEPT|nr:hypothetical protein LEP1GSC059_3052 [Leptospira noguchii serovar Panama str. CZ214]
MNLLSLYFEIFKNYKFVIGLKDFYFMNVKPNQFLLQLGHKKDLSKIFIFFYSIELLKNESRLSFCFMETVIVLLIVTMKFFNNSNKIRESGFRI